MNNIFYDEDSKEWILGDWIRFKKKDEKTIEVSKNYWPADEKPNPKYSDIMLVGRLFYHLLFDQLSPLDEEIDENHFKSLSFKKIPEEKLICVDDIKEILIETLIKDPKKRLNIKKLTNKIEKLYEKADPGLTTDKDVKKE